MAKKSRKLPKSNALEDEEIAEEPAPRGKKVA